MELFISALTATQTPDLPSSIAEFKRPWRSGVEWRRKDELLTYVKDFNPSTEVRRILLYGPVGSGKSSFINSVQRVLLGRNFISALESSAFTGASFTKKLNIHKLKKGRVECYPLEIVDIMGIESSGGIKLEDINKAFKGHILDKYTFNPVSAITNDNPKYRKEPALSDKVHCLVCILPADSVSRMDEDIFKKMKDVREHASDLEIPQVIVMTKVDKACELVNQDLRKIYYSKKIKEKVAECSNNVGVPLNAIYPVKNYAESITQDPDTDVLILTALRDILHFANDYVGREMEKENDLQQFHSHPPSSFNNSTPTPTPAPPPPSTPEFQRPWRSEQWRRKDELLTYVKDFNPSTEVLRILLYGPIGSGKSSFINSVQRVLLGRNVICALESSALTGTSFTKRLNIHKLKKGRGEGYPLEIVDIMGIESSGGIKPEDINMAFKGHILDKYTFNPVAAITNDNPKYKKEPALSDKVHCLVCILPADSVSRMDEDIFKKLKDVREHASDLEIPQVIVITKVDKECELVNQDLKKIYYSKKIKEKVAECSNNVGVPLNAIYPVKNYAESIDQDPDTDVLILTALRDILNFAEDYVEREMEKEKS